MKTIKTKEDFKGLYIDISEVDEDTFWKIQKKFVKMDIECRFLDDVLDLIFLDEETENLKQCDKRLFKKNHPTLKQISIKDFLREEPTTEKDGEFKQTYNRMLKAEIDKAFHTHDKFEEGYLEGLLRAFELSGYYEGYHEEPKTFCNNCSVIYYDRFQETFFKNIEKSNYQGKYFYPTLRKILSWKNIKVLPKEKE
jgi:hypothetical protein